MNVPPFLIDCNYPVNANAVEQRARKNERISECSVFSTRVLARNIQTVFLFNDFVDRQLDVFLWRLTDVMARNLIHQLEYLISSEIFTFVHYKDRLVIDYVQRERAVTQHSNGSQRTVNKERFQANCAAAVAAT